jgi:hypothetical protein
VMNAWESNATDRTHTVTAFPLGTIAPNWRSLSATSGRRRLPQADTRGEVSRPEIVAPPRMVLFAIRMVRHSNANSTGGRRKRFLRRARAREFASHPLRRASIQGDNSVTSGLYSPAQARGRMDSGEPSPSGSQAPWGPPEDMTGGFFRQRQRRAGASRSGDL